MKELIIHAGMPKNGTSALQVFFAQNLEKLKDEGLAYLDLESIDAAKSGMISSGNAADFAKLLRSADYAQIFRGDNCIFSKLKSLITSSEEEKTLLSSEFFATIPASHFKILVEKLKEAGITSKIIYYVRRQDQFLMSAYIQQVKRHRYVDLPEVFIKQEMERSYLNYYSFTNKLVDIFGSENVSANIFESTKYHDFGLIGHFISKVLGYLPEWLEHSPTINTSPAAPEIKLMLMANQYKPRMRFSDILVENSVLSNRSSVYDQHKIISKSFLKELKNYFTASNDLFIKKYGEGNKFPDYSFDYDYVDLSKMEYSATEVLDILAGFLVNFDSRIVHLDKRMTRLQKGSK